MRADRRRDEVRHDPLSRRAWLCALAAAGLAGPSIAGAQGRTSRVTTVGITSSDPSLVQAFVAGLRQMGYDAYVLHTRSGFADSPEHRRLLYRGRYYDRLRFDLNKAPAHAA